ncbi:MAG TPA: OsmC family protein [Prolixibacteraceae bacterium]|nr:OsmC family protein [Prolixibacteraceae bacterium]
MKQETLMKWKGNMEFETELFGHKLTLDASPESGGENKGTRPKVLMLTALAGCTGMDIISILKKMKIKPDEFNVRVDGYLTEDLPKQYEKMHIIYEFKGENLSEDKLRKAIDLSQEKYCGVSALYKKAIELTYEIVILQ